MSIISINPTDLIGNLLNRYDIWQDAMEFYHARPKTPVVIDPAGIPCFWYQDLSAIKRSPAPVKFIDCLTEGWHVNDHFRKYPTDCHYVIFSNGTWDRDRWSLPISYDLIWHNYFLTDMADTYNSPNRFCYYLERSYDFIYPKSSLMTSIVGHEKPERNLLIGKLMDKKCLDGSIYKYSGKDRGVPSGADITNHLQGRYEGHDFLLQKYFHTVHQSIPMQIFNQGYFNLVVETNMNLNSSFFLSEKTIKVLAVGIPFVMAATPHFLANLRSMGFETYRDIWNESYDTIEDLDQRLEAVTDLVLDLANFNWVHNRAKLTDIARHNLHRFQNLQSLVHKEMQVLDSVLQQSQNRLTR